MMEENIRKFLLHLTEYTMFPLKFGFSDPRLFFFFLLFAERTEVEGYIQTSEHWMLQLFIFHTCAPLFFYHSSIINYATCNYGKCDLYERGKLPNRVELRTSSLSERCACADFYISHMIFQCLYYQLWIAFHCRLPIGRLRLIISSFLFSQCALILFFFYPQAFCSDISGC